MGMMTPPWFRLGLHETVDFYKRQLAEAYDFQHKGIGGEAGYYGLMAKIAEQDLFFLLSQVLNRPDVNHPWVFDRCREVQAEPDGYLDLWSRYHFKSSIVTFGHTFRDLIANPELTGCFLSHTRPVAKQFLRQIMAEMENNKKLPRCWPHIFWENPRREAPKWSEDDGLIVKRKGNPKECTLEAYGLVDGQPTSKHFSHLYYDDIVTRESVTTPEQIEKTTRGWELSSNLGTLQGSVKRYVGTRYHMFDTYRTLMERGVVKVRIYPATDNGKEDGNPVLMSPQKLADERKTQGKYTFASQMLLNPASDTQMGFQEEWLKYAIVARSDALSQLNRYIIVDPASEKRKKARKDPDYTSMWVVGVGAPNNFYLLDGIRDRLSLSGRAEKLIGLHRKWQPMGVGYEQYGMQADIEHIKFVQRQQLYEFEITELGGQTSKGDRIQQLVPVFESGRFYIPEALLYKDHTGAMINLVKVFVQEEYLAFPVCAHDDMLDNLANMVARPEFIITWPDPEQPVDKQGFDYHEIEDAMADHDWSVA